MSLANAIIEQNTALVQRYIDMGAPLNEYDEYGFKPIIEAAIMDDYLIAELLIQHGADVHAQDMSGTTALHWAAENNNEKLCELLIKAGADVNAYTTAAESVLVKPLLRQQKPLTAFLVKHGASREFAHDFINAKLLGHRFQLVGHADIVDSHGKFCDINLEGFFLEFSLAIISNSFKEFQANYAAKHLHANARLLNAIVSVLNNSCELIRYQQYRVDRSQHQARIKALAKSPLLIIPIGYQGHAISIIRYGAYVAICDRRNMSDFADTIVIYKTAVPQAINYSFLNKCIYTKNSVQFIEEELRQLLKLTPMTHLMLKRQISGNCSWSNIEAAIPVALFLLAHKNKAMPQLVQPEDLSISIYQQWARWDQDRALDFCLKSFYEANPARKAAKASLLAAILFQRCGYSFPLDEARALKIKRVLKTPGYEYILQHYLKIYHYEGSTPAGKNLARWLGIKLDVF